MKAVIRRPRILILSLLCISFLAPIVYFSTTPLDFSTHLGRKELVDEPLGIVKNYTLIQSRNRALNVNSVKQETGEELKEPDGIVFEDSNDFPIRTTHNASADDDSTAASTGLERSEKLDLPNVSSSTHGEKQGLSDEPNTGQSNPHSQQKPAPGQRIREMEDMVVMAKAYLQFAPPNSNSHLVRELKLRIKEIERVLGRANKDSDISRSGLLKMRAMEASLIKANKAYPDCSAMASKLRAMTYNTEEQLRAQKNQASHLIQLAARTFPKGHHCLTMRLTTEYFALQPEERTLHNKDKVQDVNLYHYAVFSDNVLTCAVIVNSTISAAKEPEKIVIHVVTDSLNFPAMTMWFLTNPPGQATIHVQNLDAFQWLPSGFSSMYKQLGVRDLRFTSPLNHLRFYLPDIYPYLNKILLLDHDVVVQGDLMGLWSVDMKGMVNGAIMTCQKGDSNHRLNSLVDFSDRTIAENFDPEACVWAFGLNIFDLQEWRKQNLTRVYQKWMQLGKRKQAWKAGSLPIGQLTFYNHTIALDKRWHVLGLGHDSSIRRNEIERAAVIHYDGNMKPWLEIGISKYRSYWTKFLNYSHPYLQQCNIHD